MNTYIARVRLPAGGFCDTLIQANSTYDANQLAIPQYGVQNVINVWR